MKHYPTLRWDDYVAVCMLGVIIIIALAGCQSYKEYYPPTPETTVSRDDGHVHGALKIEREGLPNWSDNKQISPQINPSVI